MVMVIAEKFGVLPDDVEARMSEYWFQRVAEWMEGEAIAQKRREEKRAQERRRSRR